MDRAVHFDSLCVGDEVEFFHLITENDVDCFARLTGDCNPLHMDDSFAAKTTFRKRVVHGMLTASFLSTLIGTKLPGYGSLWYEQYFRFIAPVRIGEEIRVWAQVKHKSYGQRVVTLETAVYTQDGKKVISGEGKIKVLELFDNDERTLNMPINSKKGAVVISGASRGIGASVAKMLAQDGFAVMVNFRKENEMANRLVAEINENGGRAMSFKADVANREEVDLLVAKTVHEYGVLEGVVNNAALAPAEMHFLDMQWEDFLRYSEVQVRGAFNLCQSAMPHMLKNERGNIVSIASIVADNVPPARQIGYCMAKAALISFNRSLAVEYGPKGIRANCVSPGMTETDMISDFPAKAKILAKMQTPLRRIAQPDDIAGIVSFLFSEKASFLTGETIRVCGGQLML